MIDGIGADTMASVLSRVAAMSTPPTRVAQLQRTFETLLGAAAAKDNTATTTVSTAAPTAAAPASASTFRSAASYLTSEPPAATPSASPSSPAAAADTTTWRQAPALGEARILSMPSSGPSATTAATLGGAAGTVTPTTPRGGWVDRVPNERGKALSPYIQGVADRYGLDPALLAAVFWTESSYRADAVSSAGAVGLGQLMPGTAATLGVDPTDPMQNMDGSARLYRYLIDKYDGNLDLAISAYACGEGAVARAGGVPSDFARSYIDKLLGRRDYLAGVRSSPP